MILEVDGSGRGRLGRSSEFESSPTGHVLLATGLEEWAGDAHVSAYHDDEGELISRASIYSAAVGACDGEFRTTITCQGGETAISLGDLPSDVGDASHNQQVQVSWSVDNRARQYEHLTVVTGETGPELVQPTQGNLAEALLGAGSRLALSIGTTSPLTANIDLSAFRAMPIYNNLVYCAGEPEQTGRTELRIHARVHADERIEFAVQQRNDDGWSDDVLPRARFIAAFGEATGWLSSTPASVNVELDTPLTVVQPSPVLRRAVEPITPALREGSRTASILYDVDQLDLDGYRPTKLKSVLTACSQQQLPLRVGRFVAERQVLLTCPIPELWRQVWTL